MSFIEVRNLSFGYEDVLILNDLSMRVEKSEILLISGENGAGKTTLLNCISGIVNQGDSIYFKNESVSANKNLLKKFSYVMSEDTLYDYLSVKENILFYKSLFSQKNEFLEEVARYRQLLNVQGYDDVLVKHLSQGTRNKLYLAIMLSKKHEVLLLDEPFTALDVQTQRIVLKQIKENSKNKFTIIVTHIQEFRSIATKELLLSKQDNCL